MTELDYKILDFIRENLSGKPMDIVMKCITFLGEAGWLWIVLGVILAVAPKTRRIGITVLTALVLSFIVCNITVKPLVGTDPSV